MGPYLPRTGAWRLDASTRRQTVADPLNSSAVRTADRPRCAPAAVCTAYGKL